VGFEERQRAVDELAGARNAGRIDAAEYGRRVDLALTAVTLEQLDAAIGRPRPAAAPRRERARVRREGNGVLLLVLAGWGAVLVGVALFGIPFSGDDDVGTDAVGAATTTVVAELPAPGALQPPDLALATLAVHRIFAEAFDDGVDPAVRAAATEGGGTPEPFAPGNRTTVSEVVFTSDVAAAVRFSLSALGERIGRAAVVDGLWVVSRETACEVYAAAGVRCPGP
jgi:hypothetical protein